MYCKVGICTSNWVSAQWAELIKVCVHFYTVHMDVSPWEMTNQSDNQTKLVNISIVYIIKTFMSCMPLGGKESTINK
jgi:hypothetical protein